MYASSTVRLQISISECFIYTYTFYDVILLYSILLCGPLIFLEKKPSLITLRKYQQELAKLALKGENTIILTGTNAGKTYVAFHIIENHFIKNPEGKLFIYIIE